MLKPPQCQLIGCKQLKSSRRGEQCGLFGLLALLVACNSIAPTFKRVTDKSRQDAWKHPALQRQLRRRAEQQVGLQLLLLQYLAEEFHIRNDIRPDNLRYFDVEYDLNGDGNKELLLILKGPLLSESVGSVLLILDSTKEAVVDGISLVQLPVYASPSSSNSWQNLIVRSGGSGWPSGYVEMEYDGRQYPSDSSLQAGQSFVQGLQGTTLLLPDKHFLYGKPLR